MDYNESQIKAIHHDKGPMLVLAGPGSGKTAVITERTRYLVSTLGVHPGHILVVTFTKAAAQEMRQRFDLLMGGERLPVSFGTFHAVFFNILKLMYHLTPDNILREEEKTSILRTIIATKQLELDDEGDFISEVISEIGLVKGEMMSIDHYYSKSCSETVFREIFNDYQQELESRHKVDFDDMLLKTYHLFKENPQVLEAWQKKYQYILIDEFQDINRVQYAIIRMMASPADNLFIVGDDDQSIYRFRGAKPEIMLGFTKDYPDAKTVVLDINYRCSPQIIQSASRLVRNNHKRFEKDIKAFKPDGSEVIIKAFDTHRNENMSVIREILNLYREKHVPLSQIAVIFRTNVQPRLLVEKMMEYNIPFKMRDHMPNIYDHWIARNILAYIRMAMGGRSRADFLQIMNRPNRYISRSYLEHSDVSFEELKKNYVDKDWMYQRVEKLEYDLAALKDMAPVAAINYIRHVIGYEPYLLDYALTRKMKSEELLEVLNDLADSAKSYDTYEAWFKHIQDYGDALRRQEQQKKESTIDSVAMMTMHGAKGLEYQVVFIVDANESVTPHQKAVLDEDIEEERRMFYVAMTRAKDELHIYFTKERYGKEMTMSRFVGEILVDRQLLKPGEKVVHKVYGSAVIREVTDKVLVIEVDSTHELKKLDINYCISQHVIKLVKQ